MASQAPRTKEELQAFYAKGLGMSCATCKSPATSVIRIFVPSIDLLADPNLMRHIVGLYGTKQVPVVRDERGDPFVRVSMAGFCPRCLPDAEKAAAKNHQK